MRTVYTAASLIDAQLVLDRLQAADIDAVMAGQQLVGALGDLPANLGPTVNVLNNEQYLLARSVVEDYLQSISTVEKNWICDNCGEPQEGNFQQCWKCGRLRNSADIVLTTTEQTFLTKNDFAMRMAENKDSEVIRQHIFKILDEYGLPQDEDGIDGDLRDIETNYLDAGGVFWVIENENQAIIATSAMYPNLPANEVELRKMYINSAYRGKGLGKFLLQKSIDWANRNSYQSIVLDTAAVLHEAIALYKKYDFIEQVNTSDLPRCDSVFKKILS